MDHEAVDRLIDHFKKYQEAKASMDTAEAYKKAVEIAKLLHQNLASIREILNPLHNDIDKSSKDELSLWVEIKKGLRRFNRYHRAGNIEEYQEIAKDIADGLLQHYEDHVDCATFLSLGRSGC